MGLGVVEEGGIIGGEVRTWSGGRGVDFGHGHVARGLVVCSDGCESEERCGRFDGQSQSF